MVIAGTEGYAEDADTLIRRYESVSFAEKYAPVLNLMPVRASNVLDIGAGTGVDAAWLAAAGHRLVAVEPTDRLREAAQALHPSPPIDWVADSLPGLPMLASRVSSFDRVLMSAVWAHLDRSERRMGMPNVAAMLRPGGILLMSLRHGPAPTNRRVFRVSAEETVQLAARHRLHNILRLDVDSVLPMNREAGVMWTWLAFKKGDT